MKSIVLRIILLILIITIFPLVGSCQYGHSKHELTGPVEYKWFERFGIRGKSANAVSDIKIDPKGNIYITGSGGAEGDNFLMKYSKKGKKLWDVRNHTYLSHTHASSHICLDTAGNVYVSTGSYFQFGNIDKFKNVIGFTAKYNEAGKLLWKEHNSRK